MQFPGEKKGLIGPEDLAAFQAWYQKEGGGQTLRGGTDIERYYPVDDASLGVKATQLLKPGEDPAGEMGPEKVAWRHRGRYLTCNLLYRGRVLELASGCGYGHAIIAQSPWVTELISLEPDFHSCLYAKAHFCHPTKGSIICGRLPQDLPEGSFDTIVMIELFEHLVLEDQEALTPLLHKALAPGGKLIVTTPYAEVDGPNPDNPYHLYERTRESFIGHFQKVFGESSVSAFEMGAQKLTEGTIHGLGFLIAEK